MTAPASRFGFEAVYEPADYDGDAAGWKVQLPHQCDNWAITGPSCYDASVPKREAEARLIQFIAEAEALLGQLRTAPETPERETRLGGAA